MTSPPLLPPLHPATGDRVRTVACDAAREVAAFARRRLGRPGHIQEKRPGDLVTDVDHEAEAMIVRRIRADFPDDAIVGEEGGGSVSALGRTWVVDPLDGTANYARRNPLHGVSICVLQDRQPTACAVALPQLRRLYWSAVGEGCWAVQEDGSHRLEGGQITCLDRAVLAVGSCFFGAGHDGRARRIQALLGAAWQVRAPGSAAVRAAWLAEGIVDLNVAGRSDEIWDSLPCVVMARQVGGVVTDLDGRPWTLESDSMVAGTPELHARALALLDR